MTKKRKKKTARRRAGPAPPSVRLPLPQQTGRRHGDAKKYDRAREKEKLRGEIRT